ncbi:MAG: cysteine desulfurase family protein [Dehalococcoidia bacterium]
MHDYIYLDHAATSPLHPAVARAMQPWLGERFGNPSSQNRHGREADAAITDAREQFATALGCRTAEIVFTSGGSESINAALRGIAFAQGFAGMGRHLVVSSIEHHAVLLTCQYLEKFDFETTYVAVGQSGRVDPAAVAAAVRADTVLVSVMLANNEVGTVQPIAAIAAAVREKARAWGRTVPIHTDAVQAPLWLGIDTGELGVDALSLSAHKFGGPTGAGVLFLRRGVPFLSQQTGGGQERQRRAGTEHVAGIVGAGAAIELAGASRADACLETAALARRLMDGIRQRFPDALLNGDRDHGLPGIVNFSFPGADGQELVKQLDEAGIGASSGSACMSSSWEPSHVLLAMGLPMELAAAGIRFSLGPETLPAEIDTVLERLPAAVAAARAVPVS